MKKILFFALFILATNAIFAQKATQKQDGSWVLDGVQMTSEDKTALLNLLRPYQTSFKLLEVNNGRTAASYGQASLLNVAMTNKTTSEEAARKGTVIFHTKMWKNVISETLVVHNPSIAIGRDVTSKVNAIMTKYAR